nr:hypothetical protein Iba_chr10bCG7560 [Ipomoea batatas]
MAITASRAELPPVIASQRPETEGRSNLLDRLRNGPRRVRVVGRVTPNSEKVIVDVEPKPVFCERSRSSATRRVTTPASCAATYRSSPPPCAAVAPVARITARQQSPLLR